MCAWNCCDAFARKRISPQTRRNFRFDRNKTISPNLLIYRELRQTNSSANYFPLAVRNCIQVTLVSFGSMSCAQWLPISRKWQRWCDDPPLPGKFCDAFFDCSNVARKSLHWMASARVIHQRVECANEMISNEKIVDDEWRHSMYKSGTHSCNQLVGMTWTSNID